MALINPYCTVEELQEELKNTSQDLTGELERAINAASRWIDDYLGRDHLYHNHATSPLSLAYGSRYVVADTIFLPWPIITLTAITQDGEAFIADDDYFTRINLDGTQNQIILTGSEWAPGYPPDGDIQLTGTFGYVQAGTENVPTGLPPTINQVCRLVAAAFSGHNTKDVVGIDGGKTAVTDKTIPKQVYDILGQRPTKI